MGVFKEEFLLVYMKGLFNALIANLKITLDFQEVYFMLIIMVL